MDFALQVRPCDTVTMIPTEHELHSNGIGRLFKLITIFEDKKELRTSLLSNYAALWCKRCSNYSDKLIYETLLPPYMGWATRFSAVPSLTNLVAIRSVEPLEPIAPPLSQYKLHYCSIYHLRQV